MLLLNMWWHNSKGVDVWFQLQFQGFSSLIKNSLPLKALSFEKKKIRYLKDLVLHNREMGVKSAKA